ncbi:MAG: bdbD [Chthonomonadaceae bacterium]|nr:bdbD [Chthonomonadaceae bacterium]
MSQLMMPISGRDHIQGPDNAPVSLLEYGDYECPHCREAYPIVQAIQRHLGDQLRFAYRHFPLTQIHPHAEHAAEAAEAAGAQGRFWEMHDLLFENQGALNDSHLLAYAATLKLNARKFGEALLEHTYAPKVREDFAAGVRGGVNGTPAFFINGVRHDGSWDIQTLTAAILDQLE